MQGAVLLEVVELLAAGLRGSPNKSAKWFVNLSALDPLRYTQLPAA